MPAMTVSVRVTLPEPLEPSPRDVQQIVAHLERELGYVFIRRRLLEEKLDGRTALALVELACRIRPRPR